MSLNSVYKQKILFLLSGFLNQDKYCNYTESHWMKPDKSYKDYSISIFHENGGISHAIQAENLGELLDKLEDYCGIM